MKSLFCLKCLCCCDLPDCADFMNAIGMPYPDHGCSDYKWAGLREVFCRLLAKRQSQSLFLAVRVLPLLI